MLYNEKVSFIMWKFSGNQNTFPDLTVIIHIRLHFSTMPTNIP